MGLCAAVVFTGLDANARGYRYRYPRRSTRQPNRTPPPACPKTNAVPKIVHVSGTLYSLNGPGKSLTLQDDNTRSTLSLVITPETKFTRDAQTVLPAAIKTYEHVSVSYQNTDKTLKDVAVTPKPGTAGSTTGKSSQPSHRKKTKGT